MSPQQDTSGVDIYDHRIGKKVRYVTASGIWHNWLLIYNPDGTFEKHRKATEKEKAEVLRLIVNNNRRYYPTARAQEPRGKHESGPN